MSFLTLTDVAKSYGGTPAVIGMNLTVEKANSFRCSGPPAAARPPRCR